MCCLFLFFFFTAVESSSNLNFFSRYAASFRSFYFSRVINICSQLCLFCAYFLCGFSFQKKIQTTRKKNWETDKKRNETFHKDLRCQREVNWQSFSPSCSWFLFYWYPSIFCSHKTVVENKRKKRKATVTQRRNRSKEDTKKNNYRQVKVFSLCVPTYISFLDFLLLRKQDLEERLCCARRICGKETKQNKKKKENAN